MRAGTTEANVQLETRISAGKSKRKHAGEDVRTIEEQSNHETALKGGHSAGRRLILLRIDSGLQ